VSKSPVWVHIFHFHHFQNLLDESLLGHTHSPFFAFGNRINGNSEELRKTSFSLKFEATTPEISGGVIDHGFGLSCDYTVINVKNNEDTSLVEKALIMRILQIGARESPQ
jgi:hypothetical protein